MRRLPFFILWTVVTGACSSKGGTSPPTPGPSQPQVVRAPEPAKPVQRTNYSALELRLADAGLSEVAPAPGLKVALIYATAKNFTGRVIYTELHRCFLRPEAAAKLMAAAAALRARHPELALNVVDCLRPRSVQRILWAVHPNPAHVANPETGTSLHNHGCAVDLTLTGVADDLDLGTGIDEFSAGARLTVTAEPELCRTGELSAKACANRRLLRQVMTDAGFEPYSGEWWHFNGCDRDRYPVIE